MFDELEKLQLDLIRYRESVDQIVSSPLTTPKDWQRHLLEVLVCASQLYLDYLLIVSNLPALKAIALNGVSSARIRSDMLRERKLREKVTNKLESSPSWKYFRAENPFSDLTGLRILQDYTDRFALHLPEIYEETFRAEVWATDFLANRSTSGLAQLVIALQHLGRNHISFVLQALEWASDEGSWEEVAGPESGKEGTSAIRPRGLHRHN